MVLQQGDLVSLWGNASPGESVTLRGSWSTTDFATKADAARLHRAGFFLHLGLVNITLSAAEGLQS